MTVTAHPLIAKEFCAILLMMPWCSSARLMIRSDMKFLPTWGSGRLSIEHQRLGRQTMPHSVFISYVFEERPYKDKVASWIEGLRLGSNVVVTYERADVRQQGEQEIRNHLRPLIQGCAAVFVLVGDTSHSRKWIDYEVSVARSLHKIVIPIRIPGTRGGLPREIQNEHEVVFEPNAIANALRDRLR
ncbi:TIR domain-containing protein [Corallococcus interemptor]|uniref:TIR domain-containing protein n=2 Tax=Myxococcaceae TaxID=31 RepID=A0A3A8QSN1_9BACT|nr:TIR domain-containing protein [Corallococcus interemptor]